MSLSELITVKAAGGIHNQSVKNGVVGSNRVFIESEVPSKQASFKDLILATEAIKSTVENTPHDQKQESEDAHNQNDGDKIAANLTHVTKEPFGYDAKSITEQENKDKNGAGSEPIAAMQVAIQEDVQLIEPQGVSPKVIDESTGFVKAGNQEKTAIPTQNKQQDVTQIQGQSQSQSQIQGQAIITNTATELAVDSKQGVEPKQGVDSEQAVDPRQISSQSVKGVHMEAQTVVQTQGGLQSKKGVQPQSVESTQAVGPTQKSYYSSESQQGNLTTTPKNADALQYSPIYKMSSEPSLIKDYSLGSPKVMGSPGSLVPSSDITSVVSRIVSPLESSEAKVLQQKVVLPLSITQENPALIKQHGVSLMNEKSIEAPLSHLQNGQSQITKLPQTVQETFGKNTLSNIEGIKATELSSTAKATEPTITTKLPASTQDYSPSVRANQESIQSTLPNHQTSQVAKNEPAKKATQLGQQVILDEKNSPLSEGSKSLGESHPSRNHAAQKEGISDWVTKITKPLEVESMLSSKGTSTEKGAQLLKSEMSQMGSTPNFRVVPEMVVVPNGQKDEWTGEQSLEEWLSNGVQTNGKAPEVEVAVSQKRSASPIFLQQMRKIIDQKETNQGIWTKHSFALEDGEQVQISTRKVDGQVQIKVLASQNELQRALFQQSGQLRDLLQKEYNVEVEFEFNGQQSFAEQGTSDFGEQSANGQSKSFEGSQSGESEVAEQIQSTPKKGFNNNEWRG